MKKTLGIIGRIRRGEKIFVPLPKEQQLTEKTLIALERRIAKSNRKNEAMLENSYRFAEESTIPSASDAFDEK